MSAIPAEFEDAIKMVREAVLNITNKILGMNSVTDCLEKNGYKKLAFDDRDTVFVDGKRYRTFMKDGAKLSIKNGEYYSSLVGRVITVHGDANDVIIIHVSADVVASEKIKSAIKDLVKIADQNHLRLFVKLNFQHEIPLYKLFGFKEDESGTFMSRE